MSVTVEAVREQLEEADESTERVDFKFDELKLKAPMGVPTLAINGDESLLTDGSFRQLAETLNIPVPYAKRIPGDLLEHNFNYMISERGGTRLGALVEKGSLRAFVDPGQPYISTARIFNELASEFEDDFDIKYYKHNDLRTSYVMLPGEYKNPVANTNVFGGLEVSYSDSWNTFPKVNTFLWTEICSNGMTSTIEKRKFRVSGNSEGEIITQLHSFARTSIDKLPSMIENYLALETEPVTNAVNTITRICQEYRLPNKVRDRIIWHLGNPEFLATIPDGEVTTMYDIVNLFTFVGTHDLHVSDDNRERLRSIGGDLTAKHDERCDSCGGVVV